ncbi:MAG: YibE/F family protein, partial [Defluviitaleaceae bacterium]|nr:YibE/F family protein [Defluviitaleaceae bacterium]
MSGQVVPAEQSVTYGREKEVEAGDRILLTHNNFLEEFWFMDYVRINYIVILGIIFFVLVVLFGKMKGFNSIIALAFICMAVFLIFIPAILSDMNIYTQTIPKQYQKTQDFYSIARSEVPCIPRGMCGFLGRSKSDK